MNEQLQLYKTDIFNPLMLRWGCKHIPCLFLTLYLPTGLIFFVELSGTLLNISRAHFVQILWIWPPLGCLVVLLLPKISTPKAHQKITIVHTAHLDSHEQIFTSAHFLYSVLLLYSILYFCITIRY